MNDTTKPVLTSFSLSAVVDLSQGGGDLLFTVGAQDENGGSGVASVAVFLEKNVSLSYGPGRVGFIGGLAGAGDGFDDATPNSGSGRMTLTDATPPGVYNIEQVWIYDKAGNIGMYTFAQLEALGMARSFTVVGSRIDTSGPTLDSLTLPSTVDLSQGSRSISFSATAHDNAGGTSIDRVELYLDSDVATSAGALKLVTLGGPGSRDGYRDSTPNSGSEALTLTSATAPGNYTIEKVVVYDRAGNQTVYSTEQLKTLGMNTAFTVTGTVTDNTPPTLDSLSLPAVIDISKGDQQATFSAIAHDDPLGKGVDHLVVFFDHDLSVSYGSFSNMSIGSAYGAVDSFGDATPDSAGNSLTITRFAAPGSYNVEQVWVYDLAGNRATYSSADLHALGINTVFTVVDGYPSKGSSSVTVKGETISMNLASSDWQSGTNVFSLSIKYDAASMHFSGMKLPNNGSLSTSTQVSENGSIGLLSVTGSGVSEVAAGKDFLSALFQFSGGHADYEITNLILNGKVQNLGGAQHGQVTLGTASADVLHASPGHGYYGGGGGRDTLAFDGASGSYTITASGDGFSVASGSGSATVVDIERLTFSDQAVALDLNGSAGQLYRIYQAAFDRAPDKAGIGFWLASMDKGAGLGDVASGFMRSDEFAALYGGANPSNADFLTKLYKNVLHRTPDQSGYDFWMNFLKAGVSREQVLMDFSESAENQAAVIGSIQHGIEYIPYL